MAFERSQTGSSRQSEPQQQRAQHQHQQSAASSNIVARLKQQLQASFSFFSKQHHLLLFQNVFTGSARANHSIQFELGRCIIISGRYLFSGTFVYGATVTFRQKRSWYLTAVSLQTPICQYVICWNDKPSLETGNATAAQPTPLSFRKWGCRQPWVWASRLTRMAFGVHPNQALLTYMVGGKHGVFVHHHLCIQISRLLLFKLDAS